MEVMLRIVNGPDGAVIEVVCIDCDKVITTVDPGDSFDVELVEQHNYNMECGQDND